MEQQVIITISREYGSGGLAISQILAKELGVNVYDKALLEEIAEEMGMSQEDLKQHDERANNRIASRTVRGHSNSMENILNEKEAEWFKKKAESGESFIVVGRLAQEVLADHPGLITVFVTGDDDFRVKRIMDYLSVDEEKAKSERVRVDRARRAYHNRYAEHKWGDPRYYDIIINTSRLDVEQTAETLLHYIRARIDTMKDD